MYADSASATSAALEPVDVAEVTPVAAYLQAAQRTRERIVDELRDLRDSEQALTDELTRLAGEARRRAASYQQALDALQAKPKQARAKQPTTKARSPRATLAPNQTIAESRVAEIETRVRALISESPHRAGNVPTITGAWLSEQTEGLSKETARRGLQVLREREVLRVAGTGRGGAVLYALMPAEVDQ